MKNTVAAVVVTFNRKQLLSECLDALLSQTYALNKIILIDNASTDGTYIFLREKGYLDNSLIKYICLSENTGGAGGFYEGVRRAYEDGYEWIWLMDDDAEPQFDALEMLAQHFGTDKNTALASTVMTSGLIAREHRGLIDFQKVFPTLQTPLPIGSYQQKIVEIDMASFVGILVNRHVIDKIGLPRKEFFIYHDDTEYCIRLRQIGKIFLIPDSIIFHKSESERLRKEVDFQGVKFSMNPHDKLWLEYFERRNLVWLGMVYGKNRLAFYLGLLFYYFRSLLKIILFADFKFKRADLLTASYYDGLKGNFDKNTKPKEILSDEGFKINQLHAQTLQDYEP